jgi:L-ascorbate metabolism protein UlaG (beta-lactamase superfamily)
MKITKFEQSGFIIESDSGFRLAIDIGNKTPLEKLEGISCDAMIISHIHGDHFHLESIKAISPKKVYLNQECIDALGEENLDFEIVRVRVGDTIDIGDFTVDFFNVDHGPNVSAPLAENFGFLIKVDNQTIYFAGDMYNPSGIDVTNLEVDYLLLPIGGHYTFDPQEALNFAKQFKKIDQIIPMHYEKNNFVYPERHTEFVELAKDAFKLI